MSNEFKVKNGLIVTGSVDISELITAKSFIPTNSKIGTPEMYGAVGDGSTDDWSAIQECILSHSIVEFDAKTYGVRGGICVPSDRILRGKGKDQTTIKVIDNSPLGYDYKFSIFQNKLFKEGLGWEGATGSVYLSGTVLPQSDITTIDAAYNRSQSEDWSSLGYNFYDEVGTTGFGALRRNILIENISIDCNFDNQAKHDSYDYIGRSKTNGYISEFSYKVRSTIEAIHLTGENIVINNVSIKNWGYGVPYARSSVSGIDYTDSNSFPDYVEEFLVLLDGSGVESHLNYTQSVDSNWIGSEGLSKFRGNYIIDCEVLEPGNPDLMNFASNVTAFYCLNNTLVNANGSSNFPSDGGIFNCKIYLNPSHKLPPSASKDSNEVYMDTLRIGDYNGLVQSDFVSGDQAGSGSNGDYALIYEPNSTLGAGTFFWKKINNQWEPIRSYSLYDVGVYSFSGYRVENCQCENVDIGYYTDSWRNNSYVKNNTFKNVWCGVYPKLGFTSPTTCSYNDLIIENNYIKLNTWDLPYPSYLNFHAIVLGTEGVVSSIIQSENRIRNNVIVRNNIIENPLSSSIPTYDGAFQLNKGNRFGLVSISSQTQYDHIKNLEISYNRGLGYDIDTSEVVGSGYESKSRGIFFALGDSGSVAEWDPTDDSSQSGPFPNSIAKFKNEYLSRYNIYDNTYKVHSELSSSILPVQVEFRATSGSLTPINSVKKYQKIQASEIDIEGLSDLYNGILTVTSSGNIVSYENFLYDGLTLTLSGSVLNHGVNNYINYVDATDGVYGTQAHVEGRLNSGSAYATHVEGLQNKSFGDYSHAEGWTTVTSGTYAHAEGTQTLANGQGSHAEGFGSKSHANYSHAEGEITLTLGFYSHAEGYRTTASGINSHAEGYQSISYGDYSHAEGLEGYCFGDYSHAEGQSTKAYGIASHAEGQQTGTTGSYSHVEGWLCDTSGSHSHAEGYNCVTELNATSSHAEGYFSKTYGKYSHAEGNASIASGSYSHAEGLGCVSIGDNSHAEGLFTIASSSYQHVCGHYNISSSNSNDLFIIGNGTGEGNRSNILLVNTSSLILNGNISASAGITSSGFYGTSSYAVTASYVEGAGGGSVYSSSYVEGTFVWSDWNEEGELVTLTLPSSGDYLVIGMATLDETSVTGDVNLGRTEFWLATTSATSSVISGSKTAAGTSSGTPGPSYIYDNIHIHSVITVGASTQIGLYGKFLGSDVGSGSLSDQPIISYRKLTYQKLN